MKRNAAKKFPGMFEAEAKGLSLLNEAVEAIAPAVIGTEDQEEDQVILLEWIETGKTLPDFWNDFATKLSSLHRSTAESFGLDHNNYMGSLEQRNTLHPDWSTFFILERIEPQLKRAIDEQQLPREIHRNFEKFFSKLPDIFPMEKPSLIHGDLWSGNFMIGFDGTVRLIDPAVYYGHREMDLSMTKLFGGFDRAFYHHYENLFPLEPGFEKRSDIYNLYPLLIHVNLFSGHYTQQVVSIVKRF